MKPDFDRDMFLLCWNKTQFLSTFAYPYTHTHTVCLCIFSFQQYLDMKKKKHAKKTFSDIKGDTNVAKT